MYHITLSKEIKQNCPEFRGAAVFAEVTNTPYCEGLWQEIATFTQELRARETTDSIKYQPVIAATREAYKRCGKDPSRYRPSAEAVDSYLRLGRQLDSLKQAGKIDSHAGVTSFVVDSAEQLLRLERWRKFWTPQRREVLRAEKEVLIRLWLISSVPIISIS